MEKKNVFLELPCELIDKIDRLNTIGDRSAFITSLLEQQLQEESNDLTSRMFKQDVRNSVSGEISIINSDGVSLGKFNINTVEGFENLAKKIQEVSEDPVVRIKARRWL